MKKEVITSLTSDFESFSQEVDSVEFWFARDLQKLLGYSKWENFENVTAQAKVSCKSSNQNTQDHFADVRKMVNIGSKSQREVSDLMLTRYACYLIAQNGDSRKKQIAFAQTYFAVKTRTIELIERYILESECFSARTKLAQTEKELSSVIFKKTQDERNFAFIRSKKSHISKRYLKDVLLSGIILLWAKSKKGWRSLLILAQQICAWLWCVKMGR